MAQRRGAAVAVTTSRCGATPASTRILEEARTLAPPTRRVELYREFQEIFAQEVPAIPLYVPTALYVQDASLSGVRIARLARTRRPLLAGPGVVPEDALQMRIVFFGSPQFALPSLQALLASRHEVVAVVTQPDRPAGRGHAATPPPVKSAALAQSLPILQPENVSDPESLTAIQALAPDAFVVAAYGQILRQRLLDLPPRGTLNVHASLLPRWRGASPVAAAIMAGDEVSGVTLMQMVRALDAGPMRRARRSCRSRRTTPPARLEQR